MGKELTRLETDLRAALEEKGTYNKGMDFSISIAAGAALVYNRLVADIEKLKSPVIRDNEDMDFVATPDEAVRLLPAAAKEYHNALVALGLATGFVDDTPKVGRPAKEQPSMSDSDELKKLMRAAIGEED